MIRVCFNLLHGIHKGCMFSAECLPHSHKEIASILYPKNTFLLFETIIK